MTIAIKQDVRNLFVSRNQQQITELPEPFASKARAHLQDTFPRPYVFIYAIDSKKHGYLMNAEDYNHTLETIKKICCCCNPIIKVHHLIVRKLEDGVVHLCTNEPAFGSLFARACSLESGKKIDKLRGKLYEELEKRGGFSEVVVQLQFASNKSNTTKLDQYTARDHKYA